MHTKSVLKQALIYHIQPINLLKIRILDTGLYIGANGVNFEG